MGQKHLVNHLQYLTLVVTFRTSLTETVHPQDNLQPVTQHSTYPLTSCFLHDTIQNNGQNE